MRIGLLLGTDESFARAFLERVEAIEDLEAEAVSIGAVRHDAAGPYDVILDRVSHEIDFYRGYLAHASLSGTRVINAPAGSRLLDRFFASSVAGRLGVQVPKTALLPQKDYGPTVTAASLRNLQYPLPWEEILADVGTPALLKASSASGWRHATRVTSVAELLSAFDRSGPELMILQKEVAGDRHVRCIVTGGERVIVARYDPEYGNYLFAPDYLEPDLEGRIVRDAARTCSALGLDLAAVEFTILDGVPWLTDLTSLPELEMAALTPWLFGKAVQAVVDLCLQRAREGRRGDAAAAAGLLYEAAGPVVAHISMPPPPVRASGISATRGDGADSAPAPRAEDRPSPSKSKAAPPARRRRRTGRERTEDAN